MKRFLGLVAAYWSNSLALDLEYRADFLIGAATALMSFGAGLLVLHVMFTHVESLGGWTFHQALALYGVYLFLEEYASSYLPANIGEVPELVRRGDMDFVLIKPLDSQLQVSIRHFKITGLPSYLLAAGVVAHATIAMDTASPANIAMLLFLLICALVIVYAIWALLHTLAFWLVRVENLPQLFYAVFEAARFPTGAFPPSMRFVFTFVIPIAFMTTVPASAASGIVDWKLALAAPAVAAAGLWLSHVFWRFALRHYTSASS